MNEFLNTVDPNTGLTFAQTLMQVLVNIIGTILMMALTWLAVKLRTILPAWMSSQIDNQNMKTLHSAAMTIVRNLLIEGKNPEDEAKRVLDYMKSSAKDAFIGALKTRSVEEVEKIFLDIAISKLPLILNEIEAVPVNPVPTDGL